MERLRRNQSTKVVDNKLRLVIIALAAVGLAETTAYAEAMTGWRDRLAAARADRDAKVLALRTANREVVRLDKAVDRGTVQVGQGYLDHIDQNRLDPTFLLAFPIAPSDATAPLATDRQTLYVRNAITAAPEGGLTEAELKEKVADGKLKARLKRLEDSGRIQGDGAKWKQRFRLPHGSIEDQLLLPSVMGGAQ